MLIMPITVAPKNDANTIPNSKCIAVNLISPPNAPRVQIEKITRRGTLNRIAKPMAAMPAQKLFDIISSRIILEE
jgi:hypothetical protein